MSIDESRLLVKVVYRWKLFIGESCLSMEVVYWWKWMLVKEVIACDVSPVAMFLNWWAREAVSFHWEVDLIQSKLCSCNFWRADFKHKNGFFVWIRISFEFVKAIHDVIGFSTSWWSDIGFTLSIFSKS